MVSPRPIWVAALLLLLLLLLLSGLGALTLAPDAEADAAGSPPVKVPAADPKVPATMAGNPQLAPPGTKPVPDSATAALAARVTGTTASAASEEQLYAEASRLGPRIIPAIMAEVRRHEQPQWWASRACNALESLGVGAAVDIAGYLDDDHEEVRVIAATSLFFMGRETGNEIPWQLLTRGPKDGGGRSGRVRYLAETARKLMAGQLNPREEVPAGVKR